MFPINLADFLFKDGVRVLSAFEVKQLKCKKKDGPNLKQYPYLSHHGTNLLDDTPVQEEQVFTNQEGKLYVVTSLTYF